MLGLQAGLQTLLNKFTQSQPALQQTALPHATAGVPLGDLLQSALLKATVVKGTLSALATGTYALGVTLPAGAKVTRLWTDTTTALTSGGAATLALSAGATSLVAATAFSDASFVGFESHSVTPVKLAAASALTATIAGAALTAGSVDVYVEYIG